MRQASGWELADHSCSANSIETLNGTDVKMILIIKPQLFLRHQTFTAVLRSCINHHHQLARTAPKIDKFLPDYQTHQPFTKQPVDMYSPRPRLFFFEENKHRY
jgi:hypothetical protein